MTEETIVAQATPIGRGSVGIIRISGGLSARVAQQILGRVPRARYAEYLPFLDEQGMMLDQGIALYFPNPHSFTGEDVLELQGHGGAVLQDMLLKRILQIPGVRIARPGEFSERAFLNDKLDLTQAEAIADLIDATSEQAARSALSSLQGTFSNYIQQLLHELTQLRMYVEAAIDFPDEEIDFLSDGKIETDLVKINETLNSVKQQAQQGSLLREGIKIVIAGPPNAGKSSLLNALAGRDIAIVTAIAGTTRDVLREHIHLDGIPLHIIDTAGLRATEDEVEKIGIVRAWQAIEQADLILFMQDSTKEEKVHPEDIMPEFYAKLPKHIPIIVVRNKIDLSGESPAVCQLEQLSVVKLSAQTGVGVPLLKEHLKQSMGWNNTNEGGFLARRRHLVALEQAEKHVIIALQQLREAQAGELVAEELRYAQRSLSEITGAFTSDDLLGKIFSHFCIGK